MIAALALSLAAAVVSTALGAPGAEAVVEHEAAPSIVAPPAPQEMTRLELKQRPFLGLIANSWGGIGEARFNSIQPCPRSVATPTPKPYSAAVTMPKAP